jgi:hypothetical protein
MVLLAALGGCVSADIGTGASGPGTYMSQVWGGAAQAGGAHNGAHLAAAVGGVQGPHGEPIPAMASAMPAAPPSNPAEAAAQATFLASVPPELAQQALMKNSGRGGSGLVQAQFCPPGGCPPGGGMMPPPGPGLPPGLRPPGAVAAVGAYTGGPGPFPVQRTEVRFSGPNGMKIAWYAPTQDGRAAVSPQYLEAPARYNFLQAAIYRLKLSDIPLRPGVELYPTLEVVPANGKTATFLAHSAVPVSFTEEDFEQVAAGNYVVKVIYLPDPQFQDLATTGPDEVVSSRLEPGVDPIAEACRRGSILLVVRLGNIDLEAPNTPAMDDPSPFQKNPMTPPGAHAQGMGGGMGGPMANRMGPYGMMPPGMMPPGMMPPGMMPPGMMPPGMTQGMLPPGVTPPQGAMTAPGAGGVPAVPTSRPPQMLPPPPGPTAPTGPMGKAPTATGTQPVGYQATTAELAGQLRR